MAHESNPHVEAWKRARTLEDLGELTARWCEGTLKHMSGDASEPYDETEPLREVLASINRRGFVTRCSQPGEAMDDRGFGQRASVEGYAREGIAKRLGALCLWTDLLVFLFPPGDYVYGYQIPVTVQEFHPSTWLGRWDGYEELERYAEEYSREAFGELLRAWKVVIIDPCWGRESYLWEHVSATLEDRSSETRFSVEPYDPHLGWDFYY